MNISSRSDTLSLIEEIKSASRNYSRALPSSTTDTWLLPSPAFKGFSEDGSVHSSAECAPHTDQRTCVDSPPVFLIPFYEPDHLQHHRTSPAPPDSYPNNPLASHSHLPQVAPGAEPVHSKGGARECANVKNIRILNSLNILSHIRFQTETRLYTAPPLSDVSLLKGGVYLSQVLITRYTFSFASSSGVYLWKRREGVLWSFSASTD